MQNSNAVWDLLLAKTYHSRWPLIPWEELKASSVVMRCYGPFSEGTVVDKHVLLHKRRVTASMVEGNTPAPVCHDCFEAFQGATPFLCRYTFANDMWLGRYDPLFRNINLAHQLLHAMARVVAWKIVLRKEEDNKTASGSKAPERKWDFLFHQSGYVGSAILFSNANVKKPISLLPPKDVNDSFAITMCKTLGEEAQQEAKEEIKKVAALQVVRSQYQKEAEALSSTNCVYNTAQYDEDLMAKWLPDPDLPAVPPPILDAVVSVPVEGSPGSVVAEGPATSTEGQQAMTAEDEIAAARESRFVSAFEPLVQDLNEQDHASAEVISLLNQLQEMEKTAARSVATEVEAAVESETVLIDEVGRKRILALCDTVRKQCERLSGDGFKAKLENELRSALEGRAPWMTAPLPEQQQQNAAASTLAASGGAVSSDPATGGSEPAVAQNQAAPADQSPATGKEPSTLPNLQVPRSARPLSLFDWRIWSMARPSLWRYGDAGNMYPRQTDLTTREWASCMWLKEEMEYTLPGEEEELRN